MGEIRPSLDMMFPGPARDGLRPIAEIQEEFANRVRRASSQEECIRLVAECEIQSAAWVVMALVSDEARASVFADDPNDEANLVATMVRSTLSPSARTLLELEGLAAIESQGTA